MMSCIRLARSLLMAALLAIGLAQAALLMADDLRYSATTGVDFSSGTYGGPSSIDVLMFPMVAKIEEGRLSARVILPYIVSTGPAVVSQLGVSVPNLPPAHQTEQGLGDLVLGAGYDLYTDEVRIQGASLGAIVKIPTADKGKGLTTGEYDYAVQADIFKGLGRFILIGTAGYKVIGDPPGIQLNNVFYGSVGAAYRYTDRTTMILSYDTRQAVTSQSSAASAASLTLVQQIGAPYKLILYASTGFSAASPDYGVGVMISRSFPGAISH